MEGYTLFNTCIFVYPPFQILLISFFSHPSGPPYKKKVCNPPNKLIHVPLLLFKNSFDCGPMLIFNSCCVRIHRLKEKKSDFGALNFLLNYMGCYFGPSNYHFWVTFFILDRVVVCLRERKKCTKVQTRYKSNIHHRLGF